MNKQFGFSLVEIMIGITIGIIVVGAAGTFYVNTLTDNVDQVRQQRFEQAVQILKNTIASSIRRAGYSNSTTALPDVSGWTAGSHYYSNGTCALVTYVDRSLATPQQQYFGYKLDSTTGIFYSYQANNKVDCSATTTWEAMNDPTQIKFSAPAGDTVFSNATNPKLVQIHFIAAEEVSQTGTNPVSQEVLIKVFIRND